MKGFGSKLDHFKDKLNIALPGFRQNNYMFKNMCKFIKYKFYQNI